MTAAAGIATGLLLSTMLATFAVAEPRLVDSLVAVVGDVPLLRSDLERELVLGRVLDTAARRSMASDDEERSRGLDLLVDRVIVVQEARRLGLFVPTADEVAAERARWREEAPGLLETWRAHGWSERSLDDCLARRLQASRYVDSRARFGTGHGVLPRRSDEAAVPREPTPTSLVAELRRRAKVVIVGFAAGVRGGLRTSGRVSAATASGGAR
jgi:hypothetical protein